jgi:tetratricopeptide (TPR) repeat protein
LKISSLNVRLRQNAYFSATDMSKSKSSKNASKSTSSRKWLWPACIFLVSFLLYSNTIQNFYALDDDIYTRKNEYIKQGFTALPKIFLQGSLMGFNKQNDANYRPIVLLDFMIEKAVFGENPYVNHFFNVFFWALGCVVLYWFLLRILQKYNPHIALIITALFVFHPIHTDVVANIKSRDELLGFVFGMTCLLQVMKFVQVSNWKYLAYSSIFLFLSILCKENSVTLFVIIPVMIYTFSEIDLKKVGMYILPFLGVVLVYFLIRTNVLSSLTFKDNKIDIVNNSLMGAKTVSDMYATNFTFMGRYLRLLFFPHPLSWDYSFNTFPVVSWSSPDAFIPLIIYLAMVVYALLRVWKRDVYAFCIVFYLSTLLLTSNLIVKILATFAERFLFLPSIGFCIAIVFLLCRIFSVDMKQSKLEIKGVFSYLLSALVILGACVTLSRIPDWKDNTSLFLSGVETQPESARAHFAVASEFRVKGENEGNPVVKEQHLNRALSEFGKGLKIYDKDPEIYFNMGITYADGGQKNKAIEAYTKSLELRPSYSGSRNNLGVFYFNDKNYVKALECFEGIIKYDSVYADAWSNIGACYENTGRHQEALNAFKKAAKLNPDNSAVYENMSRSSLAIHDSVAAQEYSNSAGLIRDRLSRIKPGPVAPADFSFKPVVLLLLATLFGLILLVFQARKQDV